MKSTARKRTEIRGTLLLCFSVAILSVLVGSYGYVKDEQPFPVKAPAPQATQPAATSSEQPAPQKASAAVPPTPAGAPQPKPEEVREAAKRVYRNAVTLDLSRFYVGDFNGDGSQDLAVVVKPAEGMLAQINNELAMWELEDPHLILAPSLNRRTQRLPTRKPEPVRAKEGELLLAVIHGHGPHLPAQEWGRL